MAAFGVLAMLQTPASVTVSATCKGLAHRSAPAAFFLTVAVATLAGVPPLAGFLARLLLDHERR